MALTYTSGISALRDSMSRRNYAAADSSRLYPSISSAPPSCGRRRSRCRGPAGVRALVPALQSQLCCADHSRFEPMRHDNARNAPGRLMGKTLRGGPQRHAEQVVAVRGLAGFTRDTSFEVPVRHLDGDPMLGGDQVTSESRGANAGKQQRAAEHLAVRHLLSAGPTTGTGKLSHPRVAVNKRLPT